MGERTIEFETEALPHMDALFRAAMRMLQDRSKAENAVQETYLRAWKSFDRFETGTNCRAWLFQILFHVVHHERRNWFRWITGSEEDAASDRIVAPTPVADSLTDGEVLGALEALPRQFREVVMLVDVEEFSYKEASAILEIPIGTVMSRLSRGRGLLREKLAGVARSYGLVAATAQA